MVCFAYKVKDDKGKEYQGYVDASTKKDAIQKLNQAGFYLTSIQKARLNKFQFLGAKKVTKADLTLFARQFASMINAGIPLVKALYAVSEETENITLKKILNEIRSEVESGHGVSDAMVKHPDVFSPFFISLIKTGETAGLLDKMLERLAIYLEKEEDLSRKVKTAFMYPIIVMTVALTVVTYLLIFVVPVFQSVYKSMHVNLPGPTIALIAMSKFVRFYWWIIAGALVIILATYIQLSRMAKGQVIIDKFKLSMPVFGRLNKKVAVSRFIRSFAAMFASGIHISKALEVSAATADNKVISGLIEEMERSINRGENITKPLKRNKIFPSTVIQMISAGEESGALDTMLEKSADFLDQDVDVIIKRMVIKIEPLLTFMLAFVVGFIALAIYLPMFDVIRQITK